MLPSPPSLLPPPPPPPPHNKQQTTSTKRQTTCTTHAHTTSTTTPPKPQFQPKSNTNTNTNPPPPPSLPTHSLPHLRERPEVHGTRHARHESLHSCAQLCCRTSGCQVSVGFWPFFCTLVPPGRRSSTGTMSSPTRTRRSQEVNVVFTAKLRRLQSPLRDTLTNSSMADGGLLAAYPRSSPVALGFQPSDDGFYPATQAADQVWSGDDGDRCTTSLSSFWRTSHGSGTESTLRWAVLGTNRGETQ